MKIHFVSVRERKQTDKMALYRTVIMKWKKSASAGKFVYPLGGSAERPP